jgi:hypothetical protein
VERKYRQLWVDSPFRDPCLPPLVACDEDGNVVGVWLSLVRSWRLDGERIPGRTATARAVRPTLQRQGVYRELGEVWKGNRMATHGERSLGFSDRVTPVMVARTRKHGENTTTLLDGYGFTWTIPVRRQTARIRQLQAGLVRRVPAQTGLEWVVRGVGNTIERLLADSLPNLPEGPALQQKSLSAQALHETLCSVGESYPLRLDEDVSTQQWMLDYLRDYPSRGCFHGKVLCTQNGTPEGFYAGYLHPTREYELVLLAARLQDRLAVLVELLKDAYEEGSVTVVGTASAPELRPTLECGARIQAGSPASLTTGDREIRQLFLSHDVLLTGLEGEGWI